MHPELTSLLSWVVWVWQGENGWCEFIIRIAKATAGSPSFVCQVFIWCHMFIYVHFINTLNKWKCPCSPLLHLNSNAVMCKINSINLAMWGASRKHSWLSMQIKEFRFFHCTTPFPQNFAVLPALEFSFPTAGHFPDVGQAEPWHVMVSNLGPEFKFSDSLKQAEGAMANSTFPSGSTRAAVGPRSHWEMFPHLKTPVFLCHNAHHSSLHCLSRMSFRLTRRIWAFFLIL